MIHHQHSPKGSNHVSIDDSYTYEHQDGQSNHIRPGYYTNHHNSYGQSSHASDTQQANASYGPHRTQSDVPIQAPILHSMDINKLLQLPTYGSHITSATSSQALHAYSEVPTAVHAPYRSAYDGPLNTNNQHAPRSSDGLSSHSSLPPLDRFFDLTTMTDVHRASHMEISRAQPRGIQNASLMASSLHGEHSDRRQPLVMLPAFEPDGSHPAEVRSGFPSADHSGAAVIPTSVPSPVKDRTFFHGLGLDSIGLHRRENTSRAVDTINASHAASANSKKTPGHNHLPDNDIDRYSTWSGHFTSLGDATTYLEAIQCWRPRPASMDHDASIPTTSTDIMNCTKKLYEAMVDLDTGFMDKAVSKNKLNRMVSRLYSQLEIEARCLQVIHLMIRLHTEGSWLLPSCDITFKDNKDKTKSVYFLGSATFVADGVVSRERDWSFSQRLQKICDGVRHCKALATDIMDGTKIESVIYAPNHALSVKNSNKKNNAAKQENLQLAKQVVAQVEAETDPDATPHRARKRAQRLHDKDQQQIPTRRRR